LTPMYIQINETEMYEHFKTIAESVSIPILLYNNPARTNNNISVNLLRKLAEIDNIVGIKNTSLDFSLTIKYIEATKDNPHFNVLCGSDYYIFATLMHGGSGCVAGTANVAPRLVSDIYEKFIENDLKGSLEAQIKLLPLRDAYSFGSFPVVMKECLNILGLNLGEAVRPIMECHIDRHEELKRILKEMHLMS
jgi:4-hydroxy-tetrahydrodipicolinate synthase